MDPGSCGQSPKGERTGEKVEMDRAGMDIKVQGITPTPLPERIQRPDRIHSSGVW